MLSTAHVTPFIEKTQAFEGNTVNSFAEALQMQQDLAAMREQYESGLSTELVKLSASEQIRLLERVLTVFKEKTRLSHSDLPHRDWLLQSCECSSESDIENLNNTITALEDASKQPVDEFDDYQMWVQDYENGIGEEALDTALDTHESYVLIRELVLRTQAEAQANTRMEYQQLVGEEKAAHWIMSHKHRLIALSSCKGLPEPSEEGVLSYGMTCIGQMMGEVVDSNPKELRNGECPTNDPAMLKPRRRVVLLHFFRGDLGEAINSPTEAEALFLRYGDEGHNFKTKAGKAVRDWGDEGKIKNTSATQVLNAVVSDLKYIKQYLTIEQKAEADKYIKVLEAKRKGNQ